MNHPELLGIYVPTIAMCLVKRNITNSPLSYYPTYDIAQIKLLNIGNTHLSYLNYYKIFENISTEIY
jgi:hypothetical protein